MNGSVIEVIFLKIVFVWLNSWEVAHSIQRMWDFFSSSLKKDI
jgi:hypothetical protein